MKCGFPKENKECNLKCEHYPVCTRGEYYKKEQKKQKEKKDGRKG